MEYMKDLFPMLSVGGKVNLLILLLRK